jgi:hypothetical protein
MFEEHIELSLETSVLGVSVTVANFHRHDGGKIVAVLMTRRS